LENEHAANKKQFQNTARKFVVDYYLCTVLHSGYTEKRFHGKFNENS